MAPIASPSIGAPSVLIGRQEELQRIERLLSEARLGRSGVLALLGEPGIGKSALLEEAIEHRGPMRVLRARGIESEAVVPFGTLFELVRPILDLVARIPELQSDALSGAFSLKATGPQDRFVVGAATLNLLAICAEQEPLLIVLDDAQWIDGSSADALRFALRRLVADPIVALLGIREDEPSLLDASDLPVLRIDGIDRQAARELLLGVTHAAIVPSVADRLYSLTGGNPLALLEMANDASWLGTVPIQESVSVATRTSRAFLCRAQTLSDRARHVLVLAAASDSGDLASISKAAELLDLDLTDLSEAESAGLVTVNHHAVEFRHPLVRTAIYSEAEASLRRAVHGALAESLSGRQEDRRIWHLASSIVGTDESVSNALEEAATRSKNKSAYAGAASAYERAARLTATEGRRASLLADAGDMAWLAGLTDRALALANEAASFVQDPVVSARIEHLRGHLLMRRGPVMSGHAVLARAAESAAANGQNELAVAMLAEGVNACFYAGNRLELIRSAKRAMELMPTHPDPETEFLVMMVAGMAGIFGEGEGEGATSIRRAVQDFQARPELATNVRLLSWAVAGALWARQAAVGKNVVDQAVAMAREKVAIGTLPYLLHHVARYQATTDQWSLACANYYEAIQLARETDQRTDLAAALAGLAWLEARQGDQECVEHAAEARDLCIELGAGVYELWSIAALADFELGRGEARKAIAHLTEYDRILRTLDIADADLSPAPELVEAYLRQGDKTAAMEAAQGFDLQARTKGQPWALARAARCRALLASDGDYEGHFLDALDLHRKTVDVFEAARTHLAYGSRLRRSRQRVRSRVELRAALEHFDALGAAAMAAQATAELAATGETARRRDESALNQLTPQELQIALLLADGCTSREAASALFISPKTVEYHLSHIYRKLNIRSRAGLSVEMSRRS